MVVYTFSQYLIDLLGDSIDNCIVCCETAADLMALSRQSTEVPIVVYVENIQHNLDSSIEQIVVKDLDDYEWHYYNTTHIKVTSTNQTIIDLLRLERDYSVLCECLCGYYITHNNSYKGLIIPNDIRKEFDKWSTMSIDIYDKY